MPIKVSEAMTEWKDARCRFGRLHTNVSPMFNESKDAGGKIALFGLASEILFFCEKCFDNPKGLTWASWLASKGDGGMIFEAFVRAKTITFHFDIIRNNPHLSVTFWNGTLPLLNLTAEGHLFGYVPAINVKTY